MSDNLKFKLKSLYDCYFIELYNSENTLIGELNYEKKTKFDNENDPDYDLPIGEHIYVHQIWISSVERNKGYGNLLMQKFLEVVPKNNLILLLPLPFGSDMQLSVLIEFYLKYGFEPYDIKDDFNLYMVKYS